ncbi:MAG: hypothetical protein RR620_08660 [Clostridium sp.]
MKKINISVPLEEMVGQIVFSDNGEVDLTFEGLLYLNQIAKVSIFQPDRIYIHGDERENPYIVYDEDGSILEVTATSVTVSNFNGSHITTSATVKVNTDMYLLNDLMKIAASDKKGADIVKSGTLQETETTIIKRINSSLDVVANISHIDVIKAIEQYVSNKTFGERLAISLAQRNALKKQPHFSSPITHVKGSEGFRTAMISIPFYCDDNENLDSTISTARSMNSTILSSTLINVETGEVMDMVHKNFREGIDVDKQQFDKEVYNKERSILAGEYSKLTESSKVTAKDRMFPNTELKQLSNAQISALIKYAKTLN